MSTRAREEAEDGGRGSNSNSNDKSCCDELPKTLTTRPSPRTHHRQQQHSINKKRRRRTKFIRAAHMQPNANAGVREGDLGQTRHPPHSSDGGVTVSEGLPVCLFHFGSQGARRYLGDKLFGDMVMCSKVTVKKSWPRHDYLKQLVECWTR